MWETLSGADLLFIPQSIGMCLAIIFEYGQYIGRRLFHREWTKPMSASFLWLTMVRHDHTMNDDKFRAIFPEPPPFTMEEGIEKTKEWVRTLDAQKSSLNSRPGPIRALCAMMCCLALPLCLWAIALLATEHNWIILTISYSMLIASIAICCGCIQLLRPKILCSAAACACTLWIVGVILVVEGTTNCSVGTWRCDPEFEIDSVLVVMGSILLIPCCLWCCFVGKTMFSEDERTTPGSVQMNVVDSNSMSSPSSSPSRAEGLDFGAVLKVNTAGMQMNEDSKDVAALHLDPSMESGISMTLDKDSGRMDSHLVFQRALNNIFEAQEMKVDSGNIEAASSNVLHSKYDSLVGRGVGHNVEYRGQGLSASNVSTGSWKE